MKQLLWALTTCAGVGLAAATSFDVRTFGAVADGETADTAAIQRAIEACAEKGGGCVNLSAGTYLSGSLRLRSNVELHLAEGACLLGSTNRADYFDIPESVTRVAPEKSRKAFLYAWGETNIAITGKGTIDGRGPAFFDRKVSNSRFWPKPAQPRPRMLELINCVDIRLTDATFKDCPGWTMLLRLCTRIDIAGVVVDSDPRMINSDGIDVDACRDVRISSSRLRTGDDCIILRAISEGDRRVTCENVTVEDCDLDSACQAIRIGCPSDGDIRQAVFRNIRGRGHNGIYFDNPVRYLRADDEGSVWVTDLLFENFRGTFANYAIQMTVGPGVKIRGIHNITFRDCEVAASCSPRFMGNADSVLSEIRLENVRSTSAETNILFQAQATEPLRFKSCVFNGMTIPDGAFTSPRGIREPLVRVRK